MKVAVCKVCKKGFKVRSDCSGIYCGKECRFKDHSAIVAKGWANRNRTAWNKGKSTSKGEKSNHWVGDKVQYGGIHVWLYRNFGKASKCENVNCPGICTRFEWAKIEGFLYQRRRENFFQLCASCHRKYDKIGFRSWIKRRQLTT